MKHRILLNLFLLVWGATALAQPAPLPANPADDQPGWAADEQESAALKLTTDQQKAMQELRLQHRKELVPLRGDLELLEIDLQTAMTADKPDLAKINALVDKIAKARAEVEKKRIALRFKLRDQLTPEQRKIWDERRGGRVDGAGMRGFPGRERGMMRGARMLERPIRPDRPCPAGRAFPGAQHRHGWGEAGEAAPDSSTAK